VDDATTVCPHCGGNLTIDVAEVWDHDFTLATCCEGQHHSLVNQMNDDPAWARRLLQRIGLEDICGHPLRRLATDGTSLFLDWQLTIRGGLPKAATRAFISRHHAHCTPPVTWRYDTAIYNGATLLGIAIVGNPVARLLNGRGIVEVNRVCLRRDLRDALRWNAASMLYGWCAREAQRQGWRKIITYTRDDEPGTSLVAAGWVREGRTRGRSWHSHSRRRSNTNAWIGKTRWSRSLSPASTNHQPGCRADEWWR